MSIRYKILLSMLIVALLFIPVNIYLLNRYLLVKQDFLSIVDGTVPRLEALLSMQNLTTRIHLFINDSNFQLLNETANGNTSTRNDARKDELLAFLGELGEQQKLYQKHHLSTVNKNAQILDQLRDNVILKALDVFSAKERGLTLPELEKKTRELKSAEFNLNKFIKNLLLQETTILDEERIKTIKKAVELKNLLILLNGLIVLITFALSLFLMKIISRPIIQLSDFAGKIDYGNLTPLLPILTKDEIGQLQTHLNEMLIKLSKAKTKLIETSRSAGVAEIATSILHNVGNVLNSINTSVALLSENSKKSSLSQLPKLLTIIEQNKSNFDHYLEQDERGKLFVPFFKGLIKQLEHEQSLTQEELSHLDKNLTHVNQVIAAQQISGQPNRHVVEAIELEELIEDILLLYANRLRKLSINVDRRYNHIPEFLSIKTKIQQILINLIKNAIDALTDNDLQEKRLIIEAISLNDALGIQIIVRDNGIGIAKENLKKIFSFGFTTKNEGHGYGLHNCALLAQEIGGEISVQSDGLQQGSTFTLSIFYMQNSTKGPDSEATQT
ncbi:hypothetical protein TUM19329_34290 [Legionella antarctica]|uniref:histidine kinase n=1 Tax=Legionella antarctica TaxID=2708020 RepID=A0A6F8T9P2_9GAMM|nr:sensor histidine kinase [Legionella antarctica]BCA97068.1 hypothetical protein TUM19329_34290 [Legionella antarctica]